MQISSKHEIQCLPDNGTKILKVCELSDILPDFTVSMLIAE